jgi:hypothetical protein
MKRWKSHVLIDRMGEDRLPNMAWNYIPKERRDGGRIRIHCNEIIHTGRNGKTVYLEWVRTAEERMQLEIYRTMNKSERTRWKQEFRS